MTRIFIFLFFLLAAGACPLASALAACANPTGNEGYITYNSTSQAMQYCNDVDNWIAMGPTSTAGSGDITSNMIAWWKMDESAGTTAADSTGNGNDGGTSGVITWEPAGGHILGDILLGANGYVNGVNEGSFDRTQNQTFTFAAWIKRNNPGDGSTDYIMSKGTVPGYRAYINAGNGVVNFEFYDGTVAALTNSTNVITRGTWFHVAVVHDAVDGDGGGEAYSDMHIYINGVEDTFNNNGNQINATMANGTNIRIGADGGGGSTFDGRIDDARYYTRGLTQADITALYNYTGAICANPAGNEGDVMYNDTYAVLQYCNGTSWIAMGPTNTGAAVVSSGLVGWWKLDETGAATVAEDSSSSNFDGTLNGFPASPWTAGQNNNALTFDGANDYIDVAGGGATTFNFDRDDPFSISAWVYRTNIANDDEIVNKFQNGTSPGYGLYMNPAEELVHFVLIYTLGGSPESLDMKTGAVTLDSTPSAWHHIVATYDGINGTGVTNGCASPCGMHIYIDGANKALSIVRNNLNHSILNNQHLLIGVDNTTSANYYDGKIDDVRIYNRELTAAEALQIYQATVGCTIPTGVQGDLMYNDTSNVMQFCGGGSWVKMGGP